jgi:murein DD-endopeptidase MepM/ murein hydrolase activator NlpD
MSPTTTVLVAAAAGAAILHSLPAGALGVAAGGHGPLAWPMPGIITQGFGCTGLAIEPPRGSCPHFHTGVDIAAPSGMPVRAACPGSIEGAGWADFGITVRERCGGSVLVYGHLSGVDVARGDAVVQGQVVGREGSTGHSTGPHLHFEVDQGGEPVDPRSSL